MGNKARQGITETAASLAKHFWQKRKQDQEQNDVRSALVEWMSNKVAQGARLSGHVLKQEATELAASKGEVFSPSKAGCIGESKIKKEHGEKQAANFAAAQIWKVGEV